jgi:hypothetical protein
VDCVPALRISQNSVSPSGICAMDALASGTVGLTYHSMEALAAYTSTAHCVFACDPRGASDVASERFWRGGLGFAYVALGERSSHHEARGSSTRLA